MRVAQGRGVILIRYGHCVFRVRTIPRGRGLYSRAGLLLEAAESMSTLVVVLTEGTKGVGIGEHGRRGSASQTWLTFSEPASWWSLMSRRRRVSVNCSRSCPLCPGLN